MTFGSVSTGSGVREDGQSPASARYRAGDKTWIGNRGQDRRLTR